MVTKGIGRSRNSRLSICLYHSLSRTHFGASSHGHLLQPQWRYSTRIAAGPYLQKHALNCRAKFSTQPRTKTLRSPARLFADLDNTTGEVPSLTTFSNDFLSPSSYRVPYNARSTTTEVYGFPGYTSNESANDIDSIVSDVEKEKQKVQEEINSLQKGGQYLPLEIESKWQRIWEESNAYTGLIDRPEDSQKPPFYALAMFPYPSGVLHMGHVRVYTITDCYARYARMNGYRVLFPMGFDSFGLPAENAALQRGIPCKQWTESNMMSMRTQLKSLGLSVDWSREISTCSPDYYKYTQMLFLSLYESGLVYRAESLVNWDPVDKTVLANEQVSKDGKSWRSGAAVEQKSLSQWYIKTTAFKDQLYQGLDNLKEWPSAVIRMQQQWISAKAHDSTSKPVKVSEKSSADPEHDSKGLHDWLVSRQRYWGTPIPIVHCQSCGPQPVPVDELPVALPEIPAAEMSAGNPLASDYQTAREWRNTSCPCCGGPAQRETDTLDTFVDSSWYYLRYINPTATPAFAQKSTEAFLPVHIYVGGVEHAILHLLYARFVGHYLHSIGGLQHPEPFKRLLAQGIVRGLTYKHPRSGNFILPADVLFELSKEGSKPYIIENDGSGVENRVYLVTAFEKMSKSKQNGISPEDVIQRFGTDCARLFTLFAAPPEKELDWDDKAVVGPARWLGRLYTMVDEHLLATRQDYINRLSGHSTPLLKSAEWEIVKPIHLATLQYTKDIKNQLDRRIINVAIALLMKFSNVLSKSIQQSKSSNPSINVLHSPVYHRALRVLVALLSPMAPHIASELFDRLHQTHKYLSSTSYLDNEKYIPGDVHVQEWPKA